MLRASGRVLRRGAWPLVFVFVLVGVLSLGVFPLRTYLDKKQHVSAAEARLVRLTEQNAASQAHVDSLKTDAEIERIAREQYGYVKKGEEAYRILPSPEAPVQIPDVWPFNRLRQ